MIIELSSVDTTAEFAKRLAPHLKAGDVIALHGGLGVGKTTFSRALISALLETETDVPSPTYTLVQTYEGPNYPIFHFDLYRLDTPEEVFELGWDETVEGLSLIEWPDKAGHFVPKWRLDVTIRVIEGTERRTATLEPHGEDWQTRLHELSSYTSDSN